MTRTLNILGLLCLLLLGAIGGAGAQSVTFTQTYSNNFDANTTGAIAPGWVNIGSAAYKVTATRPVSGANAFGEPTPADGDISLYTGGSSQSNQEAFCNQLVTVSGSSVSNQSLVIESDSTATNFYMVNPQWTSGPTQTLFIYKHTSTGYAVLGTFNTTLTVTNNQAVSLRFWMLNGTLYARLWPSIGTEPTTSVSVTDASPLTAGVPGLRAGYTSAAGTAYADDFASGTAATATPSSFVTAATSSSIHYSAYEWHTSSASASEKETNCSSAWHEYSVSGTAAVSEQYDVTTPVLTNVSIKWSIDNGPYQTGTAAASVSLATGLSASAHDVKVWVTFLPQSSDRWVTPASVVRLVSLTTDSSSTVSAPTGLPASTLLVYSDSRGEGSVISDGTAAWPYLLGQAFNLETGVRSFASTGWATVNGTAAQTGSIVPFFTPGNDALSSWNKYDSTHSLLSAGLLSPAPGMIVGCFGINDARAGTSDATVTAAVTGWLTAARAAVGTTCPIMVVQDFAGSKQSAVLAGYNAYQSATPDAKSYLVPITAIPGVNDTGASAISADGAHPSLQGQAIVAARIAQAIQQSRAVGGTKRRIQ